MVSFSFSGLCSGLLLLCWRWRGNRTLNESLPYHPSLLFGIPFLHIPAIEQTNSEFYLRLCGGNSSFISNNSSLPFLISLRLRRLSFTSYGLDDLRLRRLSVSALVQIAPSLRTYLLFYPLTILLWWLSAPVICIQLGIFVSLEGWVSILLREFPSLCTHR